MSSTFRGLETGKSGITAAMLNLDIAGQNIANADTPGYTRQRAVSAAKPPPGSHYVISQVYNRMVGQGTEIKQIQQLRSEYLDQQFRTLNNKKQYFAQRTQGMEYMTGVLNELNTEASITLCLDKFALALSKMAEDPKSEEYRLNLQQSAVALTETVNYSYQELIDLSASQHESVRTTAQSINSKAEQLAGLNSSIASYERSGISANELRDQRNLLLDELSGLVNIEIATNSENPSMLDISIGGASLVSGINFNSISINPSATANAVTGQHSYELELDGTSLETLYTAAPAGTDVVKGGALYAHMEMVENNTETNAGIPYYLTKLNEFAQNITSLLNGEHGRGYTYPDEENGNLSRTGVNLFQVPTEPGVDVNGDPIAVENLALVTGGNFSVSADVLGSVWNIAASSALVDLTADNTNSGNADIAHAMQNAFETGGVYSSLNTTIVHLAIATDTCRGLMNTNDSLVESVEAQRKSISSVSLNEEATNLIVYKQSYNASSRLISTVDEMLDKLINGTGRVGL